MQKLLGFVWMVLIVLFLLLPAHAQEKGGEGYYDFGVFAYESRDYEGAAANFLKALEFAPDNPFYHHFLGKTYLKLDRYEDAMDHFDRAQALDPDLPDLAYDRAYLYYRTSRFAEAAKLFSAVVDKDPANVLATYHAGISYYKLNRYDRALDYFSTAAEKSPTIKNNGYYYAGICLQNMGKIDKAVEKFSYVRDHADSGLLRENAIKWLEAIERQKSALKPYHLYLKVGYQYDDNVRLEPLDQDRFADEDDYATVVVFSGRYNIINQANCKIGVGYNHFQSWYDRLKAFDLTGSTGNIYAKFRLDPVIVGFSYLPTYYWLDEKGYLMSHQLRPEVIWQVNQNVSTRFTYSYSRNNYLQNNDRDGHTHEGFVDVFYHPAIRKLFVSAGIGYEDNAASHSDQDYGQWKTRLGLSIELPWELTLGLTGRYYRKEYDNTDSNFGIIRKDDKYYGSISLSHRFFWDWLRIVAECSHTKNDSNISDYDYQQNVFTASLVTTY